MKSSPVTFGSLWSSGKYVVQKRMDALLLHDPSITWLAQIEDVMADHRVADYKDVEGEPTTVVGVELEGIQYVVKRYNQLDWVRVLKMLFRPSKARHSFVAAHWLAQAGVRTALPVALLERRYGPFFGEAYVVYEHMPGVNGMRYFRKEPQKGLAEWSEKVWWLMEKMRAAGIYHKDCKPTNFLLPEGEEAVVVDLDSVVRFRGGADLVRRRNEEDFIRSIGPYPETQAIVRQVFASCG